VFADQLLHQHIYFLLSDVVRCIRKTLKILCEKLSLVLKLVWCFLKRDSTCFWKVVDCEQEFIAHWAYYSRRGSYVGWPKLTRFISGLS
jgi:hypothetical protein